MLVQLEVISMLRVPSLIWTLPSGWPESSRTHMRSPERNVLLCTLFELIDDVVPLE